jgi:deoxycytidylate deaminase
MIINAGILRVVTDDSYPDDLASEMLTQAGVQVDHLPDLVLASAGDGSAAVATGDPTPET